MHPPHTSSIGHQSRPSHDSFKDVDTMWKTLTESPWGRIALATLAVQVLVRGVLTVPVLTVMLTVVAAAWVTRNMPKDRAARQGMLLGGVIAVTSMLVTPWFGLVALLWAAQMVAAGWIGSRLSSRLDRALSSSPIGRASWPGVNRTGRPEPQPSAQPASQPPTPSTWTYAAGVPGNHQPAWVYTPGTAEARPAPSAAPTSAPATPEDPTAPVAMASAPAAPAAPDPAAAVNPQAPATTAAPEAAPGTPTHPATPAPQATVSTPNGSTNPAPEAPASGPAPAANPESEPPTTSASA